MNRTLLCSLALWVCSGCFAADVYKSVDENGRVIYSDKPTNDSAKKVELPAINSMDPTPVRDPVPAVEPEAETLGESAAIPTAYRVNIVSPTPEFHVQASQRDLAVQVFTDPGLHPQHRVEISDNGRVVNGMTIANITRGTHQLQATVFDARGRVLGRSAILTVYVHRPRANR